MRTWPDWRRTPSRRRGRCWSSPGRCNLLEVAELIGKQLDFRWVIAYLKKRGGSPMLTLRTKRVQAFWRPILWFTKSSYGADGPIHPDVIEAGLPERDLHQWQQDLPGMIRSSSGGRSQETSSWIPSWAPGPQAPRPSACAGGSCGCDTDKEALSVATDRLNEAAREHEEG